MHVNIKIIKHGYETNDCSVQELERTGYTHPWEQIQVVSKFYILPDYACEVHKNYRLVTRPVWPGQRYITDTFV